MPPELLANYARAYVASAAGIICSYPVDTVKTHIQDSGGSTLRAVASLGPRGLYRGALPQVLLMAPVKSLRFTFYQCLSQGGGLDPAAAGLLAGAALGIFTNPLEVLKVRTQLGLPRPPSARALLIPGLAMNIFRESLTSCSVFGLQPVLRECTESKLLVALLASLPGCLISVPCDLLKTKLQARDYPPPPLRNVVAEGVRSSGWGFLFRGWKHRVAKALPQLGVTVYTYNLLQP